MHSPVTFPWLCIFLIDTQTIVLCRLSPTQLCYGRVAAGRAHDMGPALAPTDLSRWWRSSACPRLCPYPLAPHVACSSPPQWVEQGPKTGRGCPQFPAGGELWGQGKKGKGNPSLPSPTPVRWHGGLNPSLLSNGRGLLTCTATCFKITHSDFSQVKFFISKPTDTDGSLAARSRVRYAILGGAPQGVPEPQSQHGHRSHRPGPLGQWASTETVLPGSQGDWHWPLLASQKQGGRSQAEKRASPSCGQACSAGPAHPCPDLAPGSHRCRKQPSKH